VRAVAVNSIVLAIITGTGCGSRRPSGDDAAIDAEVTWDARRDGGPAVEFIDHDWDVVFDVEGTLPTSALVSTGPVIVFGDRSDYALDRADGHTVAQRPILPVAATSAVTDGDWVLARGRDAQGFLALQRISTADLSTATTISNPWGLDAMSDLAFTLEGETIAVIWHPLAGAFRLERYSSAGGPPAASSEVTAPALTQVPDPGAIIVDGYLVFVATTGPDGYQIYHGQLETGTVAPFLASGPMVPGADNARLLCGADRVWYEYVRNSQIVIQEVDLSNRTLGPELLVNGDRFYTDVWGDYFVRLAGDTVYAVPIATPNAAPIVGRLAIEAGQQVHVDTSQVATSDADAFVVFQTYVGLEPGLLHLRRLSYPPRAVSN
jgi:hypothetical protein